MPRQPLHPFSGTIHRVPLYFNQLMKNIQWISSEVQFSQVDYLCKSPIVRYTLCISWSWFLTLLILSGGDSLDTHRTMFYERGEGYTYYLRILRISYVRTFLGQCPPAYADLPMPLLNFRTFAPVQLTKDAAFSTPRFESMSETINRVTSWLLATGNSNSKIIFIRPHVRVCMKFAGLYFVLAVSTGSQQAPQ